MKKFVILALVLVTFVGLPALAQMSGGSSASGGASSGGTGGVPSGGSDSGGSTTPTDPGNSGGSGSGGTVTPPAPESGGSGSGGTVEPETPVMPEPEPETPPVVVPPETPEPVVGAFVDMDCGDFETYEEANAFFQGYMSVLKFDAHRLDRKPYDSRVCTSLPHIR